MALLEVKNLKKEFRRNGKSFFAVDGVGLSLDKGVFASVMGESGSGKSTLLNLIAGLLLPTSGEVLIDGTNLSLLNDSDLSAFRNSSVGHIPQGLSLLANLNALDNIRLPFFLSKRKGDPSSEARKLLRETEKKVCRYPAPLYYLAAFLIGFGFGIFFGGGVWEALSAGVCGLAIGASLKFMGKLHANAFFTSFVCSFILGFLANLYTAIGFGCNADIAVIGAIMILVPGFLFTNSLRDVIYGDTMSGLNRLVQVLIIAVALVFGTSSGVSLARHVFPAIASGLAPIAHPLWIQCLAGLCGTLGFGLMFNMHGRGIPFALLGSLISWPVCVLAMRLGLAEPIAYLLGAAASSLYAEIMARIRKYPATSYLMCALVPLIPGSGIYYTMDFIRRSMPAEAYAKGLATAAIAGSMAVGVLLVSTGFRMWSVWRRSHPKKAKHA